MGSLRSTKERSAFDWAVTPTLCEGGGGLSEVDSELGQVSPCLSGSWTARGTVQLAGRRAVCAALWDAACSRGAGPLTHRRCRRHVATNLPIRFNPSS